LQEWFKRINLEQQHINAIRSRIAALDRQIDDETLPNVIELQLKSEVEALRQLLEERSEYISLLLVNQQLARHAMAEIAIGNDLMGFSQKILNWYHRISGIWEIEVWVIDNNPVTVREVAVALFVLIVGIVIAKILLRFLAKKLFAITNIKQTTAATIQKIITYFTFLLVALFAMRMVNIPLAAFAFLGGAIAIGLGFGAQNLINNFISGFIMLAERPISLNDLIEIDGVVGQVEEIGARCTRIRTGENIHILVPNSAFLEKNITNWTLSDHKIRTSVRVGVIYGSPVPETRRLLLKAVQENDRVIKTPEPFVLFQDFGDNALIFDVFFWIQVNKIIERRTIESSVRFSIDDLFRKAGLVIAFPQRDIHLDTQKPLELKWVREANPDTAPGGGIPTP
jgi:small-conductance mechanosensitive channel